VTTPTGLLRYGQAGRYSGWDDRVVITALSGRRIGVVVPVRMAGAAGLTITLEANWLAVAPAGDGTTSVITSPVAVGVPVAPGDGQAERSDELRAQIIDPESATWTMAVLPAGTSDSGLLLGWVRVPPDAESAADMELIPRGQDFSTGGAIPGPQGPPGPEGPPGPPGTATLIVGSFGAVRVPADLPPNGLIPADWDGDGHPPNPVLVQVGWSLIYEPDASLWTYVAEDSPNGEPWINPGVVQGPEGPPGPAGPAPDYGVGPWRTLTNPGAPAGIVQAQTGFRYRLLGQLNSVQIDFHISWNASNSWTWPAMENDCWPSLPAGQARIYSGMGNAGGGGAGVQHTRLFMGAGGGVQVLVPNGVGGGQATWSLIIPKADVSDSLPQLVTEQPEEVTPHDRPNRPPRRTDTARAAPHSARRHVQR
jgi:hypothetical protein